MTESDFAAITLTITLATTVTVLLMLGGTPLALWLGRSPSRWAGVVNALVTLPLVLPPTVIGFYLLVAMGPDGPIGRITSWMGLTTLAFSFPGLVMASLIYSLPFVVQPISNAIASVGDRPVEVSATLGAGPVDRFFTVIMPLAWRGFLTAAVLGFAHTVGEFGIVLMIGGNIPGETQVISVLIFEHVEALDYDSAHILSGLMIVFSLIVLIPLYWRANPGRLIP